MRKRDLADHLAVASPMKLGPGSAGFDVVQLQWMSATATIFSIPKGPKGPKGPTGPKGPKGPRAPSSGP